MREKKKLSSTEFHHSEARTVERVVDDREVEGEGLARVCIPVQLRGGEAGDAGAKHGDVVADEEDREPLQVPLYHALL